MDALPPLQEGGNLRHSVRSRFLRLFLHIRVVICIRGIQFCVSACQNPVIGSNELPGNDFFAKGLAWGFGLPLPSNISAMGKTGLHSDTIWYDREYVARHTGEIGIN
jgi:hypothetical protein